MADLISYYYSLTAGEAENPRRNIPKATQRFIYRLIAFYMLGSLVIGIIVSASDTQLVGNLGTGTARASPFVIGIQNASIKGLNHVINAVILTSAWSAGNSFLFAGSRNLYSLAMQGQAPTIFRRCNRGGGTYPSLSPFLSPLLSSLNSGCSLESVCWMWWMLMDATPLVPYMAVLFTWGIACLAYMNVSSSGSVVFNWFQNLATISGFIAWVVVLISYLRFRSAMTFQGLLNTLPFRTPFQPYLSYYAIFILVLIILTNGFTAFIGKFSVSDFFAAYVTIPFFALLYLGHKVWYRTPWAIPIEEIDVTSGKEEADRMEALDEPPVPRNWLERVWFWIA